MKKRRSRGSPRSGARAELLATWLYRLRGYRVLARNAWAGGYELDLVLRRGRVLVFCEVKSKRGVGRGDPLEMVTAEKQRRLMQAAEAWVVAHPDHADCDFRFDVVACGQAGTKRIEAAF